MNITSILLYGVLINAIVMLIVVLFHRFAFERGWFKQPLRISRYLRLVFAVAVAGAVPFVIPSAFPYRYLIIAVFAFIFSDGIFWFRSHK